jgi:hypothetical protein
VRENDKVFKLISLKNSSVASAALAGEIKKKKSRKKMDSDNV